MMERETLFKGKRIDNNEWVKGYYCPKPFSHFPCSPTIFPADTINSSWCGFEVDPKTIGRYADFTDKNGTDIFEGDIVNFFDMSMRGKIVFECGAFGIKVLPHIEWDLLDIDVPFNNRPCFCYNDNFISLWEIYWNFKQEQDDNSLYEVEIIGNIHDNPELLNNS